MIVRACPNCRSFDVHRSHRKGLEVLTTVLCVRPFRCYACNHRFWGSIFGKSLAPERNRLRSRPHDRDDQMPGAIPHAAPAADAAAEPETETPA